MRLSDSRTENGVLERALPAHDLYGMRSSTMSRYRAVDYRLDIDRLLVECSLEYTCNLKIGEEVLQQPR